VILAALGAGMFVRRRRFAVMAVTYCVLYEIVMLVFTLVLPIGEERHLQLLAYYNPLSVPRYYQIYTPFLCMFLLAALLMLIPRMKYVKLRGAILTCLVMGFCAYQVALGYYTYRLSIQPMSTNPDVQFAYELSNVFRSHGIRGSGMLITTVQGAEARVPSNQSQSYYCHPGLLAILTGNNDVNCWSFDLARPNITCIERYGSDVPGVIMQRAAEKIEYLVVRGGGSVSVDNVSLQELYRSPRFSILKVVR
jgi:hypothetical protein